MITMSSKRDSVVKAFRGWVVPMVKSMPHRVMSRLREQDKQDEDERIRKLRRLSDTDQNGRRLLARRSVGFRTMTDVDN